MIDLESITQHSTTLHTIGSSSPSLAGAARAGAAPKPDQLASIPPAAARPASVMPGALPAGRWLRSLHWLSTAALARPAAQQFELQLLSAPLPAGRPPLICRRALISRQPVLLPNNAPPSRLPCPPELGSPLCPTCHRMALPAAAFHCCTAVLLAAALPCQCYAADNQQAATRAAAGRSRQGK